MKLRSALLILVTALPCELAWGQPSFKLTSTAFGSVGGVLPGSPFGLGVSAGLPVTGIAGNTQLAETVGFWRWGSLPVLDVGDDGTHHASDSRSFLSVSAPNPFAGWTVFRYGVPATGRDVAVSLRLYDVSGRLVRTLFSGLRKPGTHIVTWDGLDESGLAVGAGIYFCRMEAGQFRAMQRIARIR